MSGIRIGALTIHPLGAAIALGVLASYYLARFTGMRREIPRAHVSFIHLSALLGAVFGARMPSAAEGRFFEPPGQWTLSPSFALLGAFALIEFARFRLQGAVKRGEAYDLVVIAAAPLFVFLSFASMYLGFWSELIITLPPLLSLAILRRSGSPRGQVSALAFALLALGAFLRLALPGDTARALDLPEPALLGVMATFIAALLFRETKREAKLLAEAAANEAARRASPAAPAIETVEDDEEPAAD